MEEIQQDSKLAEGNPARTGALLPWWTWVLPFFIANLGSWLSLWLKTGPGVALWYFPTAFGIVMAYWWGPRVLLGVYLNAVIIAPLWDLPWQLSFLYALPETIEVGLSWLLFVRVLRGKVWLPDLANIGLFLVFGSIVPTMFANIYLVWQLFILGDIVRDTIWNNWRVLFSGDLATQFVFAIPVLITLTRTVSKKGLSLIKDKIPQRTILPDNRNTRYEIYLLIGVFLLLLILSNMFPIEELWILYGFIMVLLAIRYGIYVASISTSWVGFLTFLTPVFRSGSISGTSDFLMTNLGILLLSSVAVVTGRTISDLEFEIQQHKRSQDDLRNAESRYRALAEQIPPIVYTAAEDQHIGVSYVSPRIEILGFSQDEWTADPELWQKQLHPDDKERVMEEIQRVVDTGIPFKSEYRIRSRDGEIHWFIDEARRLLDQNGNMLYWQGFMLDITETKLAGEELRKAETSYQTLVEHIPPIVYRAAVKQHIGVTYISPQIEVLGFTQEEWLQDSELWLRQIHPDDRQKVMDDIEIVKQTGQPFKSEYRIQTRDGKTLWFLDQAVDTPDENGNILYRQGFMLDITARKQAEQAISAREKFLALLNDMTRTILSSTDFDSTIQRLAFDLKKVIDADDTYILYWDEAKQLPVPVATTADLAFEYSKVVIKSDEKTISGEVIRTGRVLAEEDVPNSPYMSRTFSSKYPMQSVIAVPLIVGEHKLGTVLLAFQKTHKFTENEIKRAEQAGDQLALALWEFQQSIEIQRRLRENSALAKIGNALSEAERVGTDNILQLIVDSVLDLIEGAQEGVIHILDPEEQLMIPRAISGFTPRKQTIGRSKMRMGEGVAGYVMRTGKTINLGNIVDSELFLRTTSPPHFHSLMVAPIRSGGQPIGTVSVQSEIVDAFSEQDVDLLNAFSVQATITIDNTRLFESTEQSLREVNALYRTAQGLASSLDTDELIEDVVNLLKENFDYYHVQVYVIDKGSQQLILKSASGEIGHRLLNENHRVPVGEGIIGHVAETAMPFFTNDVNAVIFFDRNPYLPDTQSELSVPIIMNDQVMGVLDIQRAPPNRLTDKDMQLMTAVAGQLSVSLQRAYLYENLQTSLEQEQSIRNQLIQSERLALVGRLLASVSHELNNPLQAIQNALFLIKDEENLSEQGKQDLAVILAEAERMASLIERLRSAYRPGRARDFKTLNINDIIEEVHALISTHMRHKEISFEFHPDPDLAAISGVTDQLHQVILNLFLNAVDVMNTGGRITVWTKNVSQPKEILVTIKDTGPGIKLELLPHIFDAFVTDKLGGTGLGLAISRDIIEQHSGRIEVTNDPEGGAVFKVWLPARKKGKTA